MTNALIDPPTLAVDQAAMADPFGRGVGYLRLSLTAACSMRCTYCRPAVMEETPADRVMSPAMIERLVRHLASRWGLKKVRLTGGEPTARADLPEIVRRVASVEGVSDIAMTTNGLTLVRQAKLLHQCGLQRVNISLDSLDPERFHRMTGVNGLTRVLDGIAAAKAVGLLPIRINTVVLAGENDAELGELVEFAAEQDIELRFIELMPMGPLAPQWADRFVSAARMRKLLASTVRAWQPLAQGHDSAQRWRVQLSANRAATIGFITPMSCNFCAACNRLRITAAGEVYPCLMDQPRGNIYAALLDSDNADQLDEQLIDALRHKSAEHPINGFTQMTILGG